MIDVIFQLHRTNYSKEPAPYNYSFSFNKYPLHMRKNKRTAATTDDYVHDQSVFMVSLSWFHENSVIPNGLLTKYSIC